MSWRLCCSIGPLPFLSSSYRWVWEGFWGRDNFKDFLKKSLNLKIPSFQKPLFAVFPLPVTIIACSGVSGWLIAGAVEVVAAQRIMSYLHNYVPRSSSRGLLPPSSSEGRKGDRRDCGGCWTVRTGLISPYAPAGRSSNELRCCCCYNGRGARQWEWLVVFAGIRECSCSGGCGGWIKPDPLSLRTHTH